MNAIVETNHFKNIKSVSERQKQNYCAKIHSQCNCTALWECNGAWKESEVLDEKKIDFLWSGDKKKQQKLRNWFAL